MDTRPLPIDPASATDHGGRAPRWLRGLEVTAGLAGGGVLTVGVGLLLLQLLASRLLADATGPGWGRVAAHLGVGAGAEIARACRGRLPLAGRVAAASLTIVAAMGVLVLCWWW